MKKLFGLSIVFIILSFQVLLSQNFKPSNYLLEFETPLRVYKSHIKSDSIVLHSVSVAVNPMDTALKQLISGMYRTVTDSTSRGVGIAAPQVGVNKRVILVKRIDKPGEPFESYINPIIIQYSSLTEKRTEGCLSIDGYRNDVERSYAILVSYFTTEADYRIEMVEGYTARIFQHEIDHLDGILFTERVAAKQ